MINGRIVEWVGRATFVKDEKLVQKNWSANLEEIDGLEGFGLYGKIILKRALKIGCYRVFSIPFDRTAVNTIVKGLEGSHSGGYEECYLLGHKAVQSV
jgi:hypothetical protein